MMGIQQWGLIALLILVLENLYVYLILHILPLQCSLYLLDHPVNSLINRRFFSARSSMISHVASHLYETMSQPRDHHVLTQWALPSFSADSAKLLMHKSKHMESVWSEAWPWDLFCWGGTKKLKLAHRDSKHQDLHENLSEGKKRDNKYQDYVEKPQKEKTTKQELVYYFNKIIRL